MTHDSLFLLVRKTQETEEQQYESRIDSQNERDNRKEFHDDPFQV